MNRRSLITGLLGAGAALVLPPTLAENAEAARRYWALDRTHLSVASTSEFTTWMEPSATSTGPLDNGLLEIHVTGWPENLDEKDTHFITVTHYLPGSATELDYTSQEILRFVSIKASQPRPMVQRL